MVKLLSSLSYIWKYTSALIFLCTPSKDVCFQPVPSHSSDAQEIPVHELPNFTPGVQSRVCPAKAPEKVISQPGIHVILTRH